MKIENIPAGKLPPKKMTAIIEVQENSGHVCFVRSLRFPRRVCRVEFNFFKDDIIVINLYRVVTAASNHHTEFNLAQVTRMYLLQPVLCLP
jgi:hypothetical protein